MPSFDRLLVLAILALSVSVQSAPVASDSGYGIIPTEGGLLPAPGVDQGGVVPASGDGDVLPAPSANEFDEEELNLDARDFDEEEEEEDLDEDNEDLEARDFDEDDEDLEARDFDEDDVDLSDLERRAASKKTKAAPKPKPTKAPKPKTTKAVAPKPKTTKAKTTKVKTTAKATKTTKPVKTTKAATTAKPTKTPKVTKTKASKTTKATGTAVPSACPIKKPAKKPRTFVGRAYDYVSHLFERDNEEFIGWHGTNSATAKFWADEGHIAKPLVGSKSVKGTSGANAELGPGLYVSDTKGTSLASAAFNAQKNPGTTGALCAIFAKSSANWRQLVRKAFIPEAIVGDTPAKEKLRVAHIQKVVPGISQHTVIRFSLLNRLTGRETGQLLIPESVATLFSAKCFAVKGLDLATEDEEAASKVGTSDFLDYKGDQIRTAWNIVPENAGTAVAQCS